MTYLSLIDNSLPILINLRLKDIAEFVSLIGIQIREKINFLDEVLESGSSFDTGLLDDSVEAGPVQRPEQAVFQGDNRSGSGGVVEQREPN